MRKLCNILAKIDSGSETVIREHLDTALGVWFANQSKPQSHKIVAVSESSVAFADGEANLFVAHYQLADDNSRVVFTKCSRLLNVNEEAVNTEFLDETAASIVNFVAEDKEDQAVKLISEALEMKGRAIEANRMVSVPDSKAQRGRYLAESVNGRFRLIQESKKNAKLKVFKKTPVMREKACEEGELAPKIGAVLEASVNLLTALDCAHREPVIEGFVLAKNDDGLPVAMRSNGCKTIVPLVAEGELPAFLKKGKDAKALAKAAKGGKGKKDPKAKEAKTDDHDIEEGVVVVNLKTIRETISPSKDVFYRSANAWRSFRADPVNESAVELIKNGSTPQAIVEESPFLALLGEDEVYEAIAPHIDAFDPTEIRTLAKAIVTEGETEAGQAAKETFLTSLGDNEVVEAIKASKLPLATQLDHLFLEGDDFDFGAADDLGNDDLSDDGNTDGMQAANDKDKMGGEDPDLTKPEDDDDGPQIQMSISADKARELFMKVLDVIGDEIEDSDEFNELKAKVDGMGDDAGDGSQPGAPDKDGGAGGAGGNPPPVPGSNGPGDAAAQGGAGSDDGMGGDGGDDMGGGSQLTGDDVLALLGVINDYFDAVGKDKTDGEEANAEDGMGSETLDDMDGIDDTGGDTEDGSASTNPNNPPPANDDLSLGT